MKPWASSRKPWKFWKQGLTINRFEFAFRYVGPEKETRIKQAAHLVHS